MILADVRGSIYATCGVLPRKKIVLPPDFIDPALRNLEPTFLTGPVLAIPEGETLTAMLPPPSIEGLSADFVREKSGPAALQPRLRSRPSCPSPSFRPNGCTLPRAG